MDKSLGERVVKFVFRILLAVGLFIILIRLGYGIAFSIFGILVVVGAGFVFSIIKEKD